MYDFWEGTVKISNGVYGETIEFYIGRDPQDDLKAASGFYYVSVSEQGHGPALDRLASTHFEAKAVLNNGMDPKATVFGALETRRLFLEEPLEWIRNETKGQWSVGFASPTKFAEQANRNVPVRYVFSFDDPREAVAFILRWG